MLYWGISVEIKPKYRGALAHVWSLLVLVLISGSSALQVVPADGPWSDILASSNYNRRLEEKVAHLDTHSLYQK